MNDINSSNDFNYNRYHAKSQYQRSISQPFSDGFGSIYASAYSYFYWGDRNNTT